jgi:hypothetical protein
MGKNYAIKSRNARRPAILQFLAFFMLYKLQL